VIVTVPVGAGNAPVAGTVTVSVNGCPDTGAAGDRVKPIVPVVVPWMVVEILFPLVLGIFTGSPRNWAVIM
jgi:hypothetical protein